MSGRASTTGRGYGPSTARRSCRVGQGLLYGSCLGPARQTRPIWPSIPPHDNDGPHLSCHHLVRHSTSYYSPLMPPPPRHSILGRRHRSRRLLPVFIRHQPRHRLAQWLLHVHGDVSHPTRTIFFTVVGRPVRLSCLRPVLPPQPAAIAHGRRTMAFLRACCRGVHGGVCHA